MLEKLRNGDPLTGKEKQIHDQGLVTRLVALNHERAAEEKRGLIRYDLAAAREEQAAALSRIRPVVA